MQRLAGARGFQRGEVELQVVHLQHLAALAAMHTRHQRLQPHFQFRQRERLGQVVVRAGTKAGDLVGQLVARGQHDHRHVRAVVLAQTAQDLGPFQARQHPVQHDRVVGLGAGQVQPGEAIRGGVQGVSARLEIVEEVRHQTTVVFDDQQPHRRIPSCA